MSRKPSTIKAGRWLPWLAVAVVLLVFGYRYAGPIWDIDTGWHVATGRWIAENQRLPQVDPFGVHSIPDGAPGQVVLKGYWLAQWVMFEVTRSFGEIALIGLRLVLLCGALAVFVMRARALDVGWPTIALVGTLCGASLASFTGDRPQLFSFFLAGVLFWLAEQLRRREWRVWAAMALTGLAWGNMHGGWTLAAGVLAVQAGAEVALGWRRQRRWELFPLAGVLLFAGAALISPVGMLTIDAALQIQQGQSVTAHQSTEYVGSFLARTSLDPLLPVWVVVFHAVSLLAVIGLLRERAEFLPALVVLAALSVLAVRYHPFFLVITAPWVALGLEGTGRWLALRLQLTVSRMACALTALSVAVTALVVAIATMPVSARPGRTFMTEVLPGFPLPALQEALRGRMVFNHFSYGGYLLWQVPGSRLYVDGRRLDAARFDRYTQILWATGPGRLWLGAEGFDAVIMPLRNPGNGQAYPLPAYLLSTGQWRVALRNDEQLVLLRD
ncbi:MAG: hypothetical protein FIB06_05270 [Betaproteobacteria bacterium]|nr:hypothetical protein [Betaproteobacteria bacterium]